MRAKHAVVTHPAHANETDIRKIRMRIRMSSHHGTKVSSGAVAAPLRRSGVFVPLMGAFFSAAHGAHAACDAKLVYEDYVVFERFRSAVISIN